VVVVERLVWLVVVSVASNPNLPPHTRTALHPAPPTHLPDCGSLGINGASYNIDQLNVADGTDACNRCNCGLAFIDLSSAINPPGTIRCGETVQMTYTSHPGPSPPPPHPSPPHPHPHPPSPPPPAGPSFDAGSIFVKLAAGALTAASVNKSVPAGGRWNKTNNFSFVGSSQNRASAGCHLLGDITVRLAPTAGFPTSSGAAGTPWAGAKLSPRSIPPGS
jgi:hypothetical protein